MKIPMPQAKPRPINRNMFFSEIVEQAAYHKALKDSMNRKQGWVYNNRYAVRYWLLGMYYAIMAYPISWLIRLRLKLEERRHEDD